MAVLRDMPVRWSRSAEAASRPRQEAHSSVQRHRRSIPSFAPGHFSLLVCLTASLWFTPGARAQGPSEYHVKAAFLYNFTKFIEWPAQTPNLVDICIVGEDPFGNILDATMRGKTLNSREIRIQRMKTGENPRGCRIAFMGASEHPRRSVLESLQETNTLTVGESPGFADHGGIINFVIKDNRVHFEINVDAAERARLKISSKLLSLAKIVRD